MVYSTKYQYAGALDCIGKRKSDGKIVILDFKTSNFIHDNYALQVWRAVAAWFANVAVMLEAPS